MFDFLPSLKRLFQPRGARSFRARLVVQALDRRELPTAGPNGIFCSCGPTTGFGEGSVTHALAVKDFVSRFLVRIGWNLVEPADGQFAWGLLDEQVQRAAQYGKQVTLAVVNGAGAPSWLYADGAQEFDFLFHGTPTRIPVPWDQVFLAKWTELIQQFGARYDGNPAVALVHITNSSGNGFEMQLPDTPPDRANWNALGYTPQRVSDSWIRVVDAFAAAFPSTPLDVELHPVLQSDEVPDAVMSHAWNTYGTQVGAFAGWWSQRNTTVYAGEWQLLQQGAVQSFSTVQFVTNATHDPNGFGDGGIHEAIHLAYHTGIRYMEPWDVDLLNPAFDALFRHLARRLADGGAPGGAYLAAGGLGQGDGPDAVSAGFTAAVTSRDEENPAGMMGLPTVPVRSAETVERRILHRPAPEEVNDTAGQILGAWAYLGGVVATGL
jgi:hypothetical protein